MAYQQKFNRWTDKSCVVQKGTSAGICPCGAAVCHRFSWSIIILVSSATRGRIQAGVYLPFNKIILFQNYFQMSYWLGEASLPFTIRGFYLQYIKLWSPNTCLPSSGRKDRDSSGRKDRDIWRTHMEIEGFQVMEHPLWQPYWRSIGFALCTAGCAGDSRHVFHHKLCLQLSIELAVSVILTIAAKPSTEYIFLPCM